MIPLTPRQHDCFVFVRTYIAREGTSPSYREIGEALGVHPASVFYRIQGCIERGWLRRTNRKHSMEIVDNSLPSHEEWERICAAAADLLGCQEKSAKMVMLAIQAPRAIGAK